MKKVLILFSLMTSLMIFSVVPASAENNMNRNNNTAAANYRANALADDDGFDWGWLGLLGLVGLAGMRSRERGRDRA
jgi:hypothetical protein